MFSLEGKRALITGAGQGIGRATAIGFASAGAQVVVAGRDGEQLAALNQYGIQKVAVLDLRDSDAIQKLPSSIGPVDILVNCAGDTPYGTVLDCTFNEWERSFAVNTTAVFAMIKLFIPGMISKSAGSIINVSSVASSLRGVPNRFAYSAAKAAVVGITRSIAADFSDKGIRCNAICPATVDTPSLNKRIDAALDPDALRASLVSRQPIGRMGTSEEVAALALYLASDESSFVTGAIVPIDGGWTAIA